MGDDPAAEQFRRFADDWRGRAPLYARLSERIADDAATRRLLLHAPELQRQPVLLFAAVHHLLLEHVELGDVDEHALALARHYPNLTEHPDDDDPYPAFARFCSSHEPALAGILANRNTQTNEVGRCALVLPALGLVGAEVGPVTLVDVGTSAGLNLLIDRYEYRYDPGGTVGGPSPVVLRCGTRGAVPLPATIPTVVDRVGIDHAPVDVLDPDATRWLEACVWPDQLERFERLRAALELARTHPPPTLVGDAVTDIADTIEARTGGGHPVVLTSWALSYLTTDDRGRFVHALDRIGDTGDLTWIALESPQQTPGLPWPDIELEHPGLTVVLLARWRRGVRQVTPLASAHPHGAWLHWRAAETA